MSVGFIGPWGLSWSCSLFFSNGMLRFIFAAIIDECSNSIGSDDGSLLSPTSNYIYLIIDI